MKQKRGRGPAKPSPFGRNLSKLMLERDLGIRDVAQLAGVGPSTVMSWKSGATPSDLLAVRRLAEALRIDFCFLLTGLKDPFASDLRPMTPPAPGPEPDYLFEGYARIVVQKLEPSARPR